MQLHVPLAQDFSYVCVCVAHASIATRLFRSFGVEPVVVVVALWRCCCRALFRGFSGMFRVSFDASGHLWAALWDPLGSRERLLGPIGFALGGPWASLGAPWVLGVACGVEGALGGGLGWGSWGAQGFPEGSLGILGEALGRILGDFGGASGRP